ncbi:MAG: hypothetical protein UR81_C0018G0005 [Candidatus Levybacteria bacterium GW2011_GWB1_35_5]|nr:MAG: hypothetical protein UR81_C0018G0005 [Candidatus Levybacteria bacterium GW2011_GWB1_35_5]
MTLWGIMQRMRGKELLYITPFVLGGCGASSGQPIPPECVMPAIGIGVATVVFLGYRSHVRGEKENLLRIIDAQIDETYTSPRDRHFAKKDARRQLRKQK